MRGTEPQIIKKFELLVKRKFNLTKKLFFLILNFNKYHSIQFTLHFKSPPNKFVLFFGVIFFSHGLPGTCSKGAFT